MCSSSIYFMLTSAMKKEKKNVRKNYLMATQKKNTILHEHCTQNNQ